MSLNWTSLHGIHFKVNRQSFGKKQNHERRQLLSQTTHILFNLQERHKTGGVAGEDTETTYYNGSVTFFKGDKVDWLVTSDAPKGPSEDRTFDVTFRATDRLLAANGYSYMQVEGSMEPEKLPINFDFVISQRYQSRPRFLYVGINHPDPQQTGVIGAEEEPGDIIGSD